MQTSSSLNGLRSKVYGDKWPPESRAAYPRVFPLPSWLPFLCRALASCWKGTSPATKDLSGRVSKVGLTQIELKQERMLRTYIVSSKEQQRLTRFQGAFGRAILSNILCCFLRATTRESCRLRKQQLPLVRRCRGAYAYVPAAVRVVRPKADHLGQTDLLPQEFCPYDCGRAV